MNALLKGLIVSILLLALDTPWLLWNFENFNTVMQKIQGSPLRFRPEAILIVYPALAFLLLRAKSVGDAFLLGAATYSVYDFTNYSSLTNYPLSFAITDTLWGGTLFAIGKFALDFLKI